MNHKAFMYVKETYDSLAIMQGGTGAAPATWATLQTWLRRQSMRGVLLVFENCESMAQKGLSTCEACHALL